MSLSCPLQHVFWVCQSCWSNLIVHGGHYFFYENFVWWFHRGSWSHNEYLTIHDLQVQCYVIYSWFFIIVVWGLDLASCFIYYIGTLLAQTKNHKLILTACSKLLTEIQLIYMHHCCFFAVAFSTNSPSLFFFARVFRTCTIKGI